MKKFTTTVGVIRDINEKELSELQKIYREYFASKMEKYKSKIENSCFNEWLTVRWCRN